MNHIKKTLTILGIMAMVGGLMATGAKEYLLRYMYPNSVQIKATTITVELGDITDHNSYDITHLPRVQVLVNAANPQVAFRGMAGVTKAIADGAGDDLPKLEEAVAQAKISQLKEGQLEVPAGDVLITSAEFGKLKDEKFRTMIHAVAPDLRNQDGTVRAPTDEDKKILKTAYMRSIMHKPWGKGPGYVIALPLLGAGVYGWDQKTAMDIAAQAAVACAQLGLAGLVREIMFVLYWDSKNPKSSQDAQADFIRIIREVAAKPVQADVEMARQIMNEMFERHFGTEQH